MTSSVVAHSNLPEGRQMPNMREAVDALRSSVVGEKPVSSALLLRTRQYSSSALPGLPKRATPRRQVLASVLAIAAPICPRDRARPRASLSLAATYSPFIRLSDHTVR